MFICYFKAPYKDLLGFDEKKLMSIVDFIKAETRQDIISHDELSALLRNSQIPTLVVEGRTDVRIYNRWIEQRLFGTYRVDVLAADGLENFFRLYERRSEFMHAPVIFIAGREMWLFSGIPEAYKGIIWTNGYSIENDIYSESRIERLIQYNPTIEYDRAKEAVIKWFAFEVEEYFNTKIQRGTPHLDELISEGETELNKDFLKKYGFDRPPKDSTINNIKEDYLLRLPGKLLFQMLERFSGITFDGLYNTALVNYNVEQHGIIGEIRRNLNEQRAISSQNILSNSILSKSEEQKPPRKNQSQFLPKNESTSNSEVLVGRLAKKDIIVKEGNNTEILKELIEKKKKKFSPITTTTNRDDLLSLYSKQQLSIYVVDREMRVFSKTPERYLNVIWTKGYSLENDLYIGGGLENLLDPHEKWKHRQVLNATIKWFAFEVEEFLLTGLTPEIDDDKLSKIVLPGQLELNEKFCRNQEFREPPLERIQEIKDAPEQLLPGKYLFQILERFLNTRGRSFNYEVNAQRLLNIALSASGTQQPLDELAEQIRTTHNRINNKLSPSIQVGARINAKILRKDGSIITVQLMTDNQEEITFECRHCPRRVDDEHEVKVISVDSERVKEVIPIHITPIQQGVKVGDKINAKIIKKDGFKVTVQLQTDNNEKIVFEHPYYPGKVGEEPKLRVMDVDSTGRVTKVVP